MTVTNKIPAPDTLAAVSSKPSSVSLAQRRFRKRNVSIAASLFLASCEGTITTDLTVGAPADPDLQQVVAPFTGIEFETSSGGTESFAFDDAERIDLLTFVRGAPIRLLSDEDLPEGTYTGVRLVFDDQTTDSAYVIDGLGAQRELRIENGAYADMDFTVEEDESSSEEITLTLDLRLSLSVDDNDRYTLRPVLRSVRTEQAGELEGLVSASCLNRNQGTNRGAVYLFQGRNVTPDDFDGNGVEPYATAPIVLDGSGFNYRIGFIPAGTYTVALACDGSEENPTTDDDLNFRATATVDIDEGETTRRDIQI